MAWSSPSPVYSASALPARFTILRRYWKPELSGAAPLKTPVNDSPVFSVTVASLPYCMASVQ